MSNHQKCCLQGWGHSYRSFKGSDHRFNDRSGALKRRFSDVSDFSDRFYNQKEMNRYKEREQQLSAQVESQVRKIAEQEVKIKALEDEVKELGSAKEEYQRKSKSIKNYCNLMDAKLKAREVEKVVAIKTAEEQFKRQLEDKQRIIDGFNNSFVDKNKSLESTVQQLKKENSALNKILKEKDIALQGLGDSLQTIEQLKDENVVKGLRANKYRVKYETLKTEMDSDLKKIKSENTKYKNEITSLKRQRLYFQNNNENNKRKSLAISHTQIRQKEIYGDACRKFGQNSLDSIEDIFEQVTKLLAQVKKEKTSEALKNLANIVTDLKEKNNTIEEQEKIILEKRSDGKVACGQCGSTFDSTGDLSRHMTVKHNICTTDRFQRQDDIQIVTIEDD